MRPWRAVRLVAMREILERGRSRGLPGSRCCSRCSCSWPGSSCRSSSSPTRRRGSRSWSPRRPASSAALKGAAAAYDVDLVISTVPDRAAAEAALAAEVRRRRARRPRGPVGTGRAGRPGTGRRPGPGDRHRGGRLAAGGGRRPAARAPRGHRHRAADGVGHDRAHLRQRRDHPDVHRHLLVRDVGPDRRRRGEAEPGRGGRPVHRPAARPARRQGARHRHARAGPAGRAGRGRDRGGAAQRAAHPAPDHAGGRRRSSCSGSCWGSRSTRPPWGSWGRSRRGSRTPRTRRCRSR